jgi:hypothetical protein
LHYNGTCRWGICITQGSDWVPTRWTNGQPSKPKLTHPWNWMMNPGCQGTELSCWSQLTISMYPKALDGTHCAQCCQDAQFLPNEGEVSDTLSPKTIMSEETLNYKKHLSLQVGQYCQVHKEDTPCNSQSPRINCYKRHKWSGIGNQF